MFVVSFFNALIINHNLLMLCIPWGYLSPFMCNKPIVVPNQTHCNDCNGGKRVWGVEISQKRCFGRFSSIGHIVVVGFDRGMLFSFPLVFRTWLGARICREMLGLARGVYENEAWGWLIVNSRALVSMFLLFHIKPW